MSTIKKGKNAAAAGLGGDAGTEIAIRTPPIIKTDKEAQTTEVVSSSVPDAAILIVSKDGDVLIAKDPSLVISSGDGKSEAKPGDEEEVAARSLLLLLAHTEEEEEEAAKDKGCLCSFWHHVRGMVFCLLSALFVALSTYSAHVLLTDRNFPSPTLLAMLRCAQMGVMGFAALPLFQYGFGEEVFANLFPIPSNKIVWILLIIRGFAGIGSMLFVLNALKYIKPGEATTIVNSSTVLILIFARVFLKEPLGILQAIAAVIAFVGVVVISRPPFLMGSGQKMKSDHFIGIAYAMGATFALTLAILVLRVIRNLHFLITSLSLAVVGVVVSGILAAATNELYIAPSVMTPEVWGLLACCTTSIGLGIVFQSLGLQHLPASMYSVGRSSEVVFSFLLQLFSHRYPELLDYIGAGLVLFSIFFIGFQKYIKDLHPTDKLRIKLSFLLI